MTSQEVSAARVQPTATPPAAHPVDRLYRLVAGNRVLGAVLVLLALTLLAGAVLPQLPAGLGDQEASTRWLAETSSRYGSLGAVLEMAGLFDLRQSLWLRSLLGLLTFILLLRLGLSVGSAARRLRRPDPAQAAAEAQHWPLQSTFRLEGDLALALESLSEDLTSEGWCVTSAASTGGAALVAERSTWGLWAGPLAILGLLLVIAGLWTGQLLGWQESGITLVPGQPVRLDNDSSLTLALAGDASASGAGIDSVTVQPAGGSAASGSIAATGTARVAGLTVERTGAGQALTVSAADGNGQPVQLQLLDEQTSGQSDLVLVFDQPRAERVFLVPSRQLAVSVVAFPALPERGFAGPTFLVQAFEVGSREPVYNEFVEGNADVRIEGDVYRLRTGSFVTVDVSRNPGLPLMLAGVLLAAAGLLLGLLRPSGRLSVALRSQREQIAVDAALDASPGWRQAGRWLSAWTSTYETEP